MPALNESIVEDAALEWFGELGYEVGHGPHPAPSGPTAERESFGEVVLVRRLNGRIPRLSNSTRLPVCAECNFPARFPCPNHN